MKTLIFDFDGTIADTLSIGVDSINLLSEKYGYKRAKYREVLRDQEASYLIKKYLKLSALRLPKYLFDLKKTVNSRIGEVKTFKGMPTVLEKLSKTHNVMILSSNSEKNIKDVLRKDGIKIKKIYSNSSLFGKSRVISKVIKKNKLKKEDVIYIGDESRDIEACKKVGVRVAAVTWGYNSEKLLKKHKPDFLIGKPADLLKLK